RGTAQNPDIYFQSREASNKLYENVPDVVAEYMEKIKSLTGREYHLFDYYGAKDAEYVIVAMGSVCETIEETIDYLSGLGEKVGLVKVRLYRPFSEKHFLNVIPSTVKRIAVLDRTKEPGSIGEPLYLDVVKAFFDKQDKPLIVGGRYGLGSKDTTPSQIIAVYENLKKYNPVDRFTIGIKDDVTMTSLDTGRLIETVPQGTVSCKFYGLGSDGTVGANKSAIKIIGDNTNLYVQGYFQYDSKKSGGTTVSHLRFGQKPIKSSYLVYHADYIACHNKSFIYNYDILKGLKNGGTFVLNCPWSESEFDEKLPASMKRYIARNKINFYTIDAISIAREVGLGGRINMIMQTVFFRLINIIPFEDAIRYLKESIQKTYGSKGQNIVDMNIKAVDRSLESLKKVNVPASWENAVENEDFVKDEPEFLTKIQRPMAKNEGDDLPVSAFLGMEDGTFPLGTTAYEKRGIAVMIPQWQIEKCIQCNQCSLVCPHAVIRPFLLNDEEVKNAPPTFETKKAVGRGLEAFQYRIQVSPLDCTGCGNCADVCPASGKALVMMMAEEEIERQADNWEYAVKIKPKDNVMEKATLKGSQFFKPLFEFNGACPGCGETPYIKLLTQLFGDRMIIANATGCSSIYGASAPSIPYTTNDLGKGPAWANSLFEDNAEYGYGIYLANKKIRQRLGELITEALKTQIPDELKNAFVEWLNNKDDGEASQLASSKIINIISHENLKSNKIVQEIYRLKDYLVKKSHWIIGGDGWAYDIGFGGLDHVLASGEDVNVLVLDTEVYSNTGGQSSKSTPTAAIAKFAASGKKIKKKDLGLMAISYGYVYVAQIALGANMNHTVRAIAEAEKYKGPSLIIAYSPCINHGIKSGMGTSIAEEKKAVDAGYWHLYRYNPELKAEGKNPFTLDSKEPVSSYVDFIKGEIRYSSLETLFPDLAQKLYDESYKEAKERFEMYKALSQL
ncbi:MAG: pyruvate:ferredoxin (flavodoxin) oxidoreductase, partial [Thermoanaerobacterium sp.]|nr:pyruvate:ferredoxin (flavodoxin) oxidoreductase [Thermoanaerobacterium sp.]